ncbi:MAG: hypothetical protein K8R46_00770 [Pirellulales bacterium]|nr:hypothetical protein [Pirellulales bacterium]
MAVYRKQYLIAVLLLFSVPGTLWAGGAVQRRQRGINVHRQQGINVRRTVTHTPVKSGTTIKELLVQPEAPKKAAPKIVLPPTPEQDVLVSVGRQSVPVSQSIAAASSAVEPSAPVTDQGGFYQEMARLFSRLDENSEIWTQIDDPRVKMLTVSRYVELFQQEGARIKKPPLYYSQLIDNMVRQDPAMISKSLKNDLRAVAIMEYDFDNGTNKDVQARSILSGQAYIANKKRLGL